MIECPSCGMPVKKGSSHCSTCGEAITSGLTGAIHSGSKQTSSLDLPPPKPQVIVEEAIPTTSRLPHSNGDQVVQTCLRCNSVLNPAAKFCSVCGRATEPSSFERTIDATRTARGRVVGAVRRIIVNVRERPEVKDSIALVSFIFMGLAVLCFLYSFFIYPGSVAERPDIASVAQSIRSLWWLGFGALLMAGAAFLKR